jgi:hypothetical protein
LEELIGSAGIIAARTYAPTPSRTSRNYHGRTLRASEKMGLFVIDGAH